MPKDGTRTRGAAIIIISLALARSRLSRGASSVEDTPHRFHSNNANPGFSNEAHAIWNATEVSSLLRDHSCAKLYINGHNHKGHYVDADGLHYLTLDGMLETKDTNAFGYAEVYPDRLEITGFERQESYVLKFR